MIFIGIDWAEEHHDVELQGGSGKVLKTMQLSADVVGLARLQEAIAEQASEPGQVVVGIESSHGLLVNALLGSGYLVYSINPLTSARTRQGESPAGAKSDRTDAHALANLVRTRRQDLRPARADSPLAQAIQVRARAHVRAIRHQRRLRNQLRSALAKFYPAALRLLGQDQDLRDALAVLSVAPSPERGRSLSLNRLKATLARHGRQRYLESRAIEIQAWLRSPQLELGSSRLVSAYADEVSFWVRTLLQLRSEIAQLQEQMAADFREHPDAEIYRSLPGLADTLGARVLAESGDEPTRYRNAKARKNYSGNSPITKSSGKWRAVNRRVARNRILADASFRWALVAIQASPGAARYYEQLTARHKNGNVALRALANRLTGILHGCLRQHCLYDEATAWPPPPLEDAA